MEVALLYFLQDSCLHNVRVMHQSLKSKIANDKLGIGPLSVRLADFLGQRRIWRFFIETRRELSTRRLRRNQCKRKNGEGKNACRGTVHMRNPFSGFYQ